MSEVSQVSNTTSTTSTVASTSSGKGASSVDYDAFLSLLVAEMQNQDPTKPMESTEYVAQLASFSSVEQAIQTNEKLDALLNSSFIANAGSLIGKTITSANGEISGIIEQVKVVNGQGTALLENGEKLAVNDSVTIGN